MADRVKSGEVNIKYCPIDERVANLLTKPLQGYKFRRFRDAMLNIQPEDKMVRFHAETSPQECSYRIPELGLHGLRIFSKKICQQQYA